MLVTDSDLDRTIQKYEGTLGSRRNAYFSLIYMARRFEVPVADLLAQCAFTKSETGLDGFFYEEAARTLHLFICVWSTDHRMFQEGLIPLVQKGMEKIFQPPPERSDRDPVLSGLWTALNNNKATLEHVAVNLVFNGGIEDAGKSGLLEALRNHLERKCIWIDRLVAPRRANFQWQFRSNRDEVASTESRHIYRFNVRMGELLESELPGGIKMHIGFLRLLDLNQIHEAMEGRLLSRNIRFGLPPATSPNRAIRSSLEKIVLKGTMPPTMFAFHHNGVTLHAEDLKVENGETTLTEPRLVNGAQTVATLVRFLRENYDNPDLTRNWMKMRSIPVLAKIVTGGSEEFLTSITISTNRQNPVNPWNLRAHELLQLRWAEKFKSDVGAFYARQEGAMEGEFLVQEGYTPGSRPIEVRRLARTLLATTGKINLIRQLPEVFEREKLYQQAFAVEHLKGSSRAILLAYKLQFKLGLLNRTALQQLSLPAAKRSIRYLFWALAIQALFNDSRLPDLARAFGGQVEPEREFMAYVGGSILPRLMPVVKLALEDARFAERAALLQFSFMDTPEFFDTCVLEAGRKWGWVRRSFPTEQELSDGWGSI